MFLKISALKICTTLLVIFFNCCLCKGQDFEPIFKLINERKLDSAKILSQYALKQFPSEAETHFTIAKIAMLSGELTTAITSYQKAIDIPTVKKHITGWALHDIAICNYRLGKSASSNDFFKKAIATNATKNMVNSAKHLQLILGFDSIYTSWKNIETPHFIFHFQSENVDIRK